MKKEKILAILAIVISAVLAVVMYSVLPETVTVQLSAAGQPANTMPKLVAIFLPAALGIGGGLAVLLSKGEAKNPSKPLLISLVGIIVFGLTYFVNR